MLMILLGIEMFDTQNVVGRRDIGKQRNDDKRDADDVEPCRRTLNGGGAAERGASGARQGENAQEEPHDIERRLEMHFPLKLARRNPSSLMAKSRFLTAVL